MAQTRKTIFDLGGPEYLADPRVAEAQAWVQIRQQQEAQNAAIAAQQAQTAFAEQQLSLDQQRFALQLVRFADQRLRRLEFLAQRPARLALAYASEASTWAACAIPSSSSLRALSTIPGRSTWMIDGAFMPSALRLPAEPCVAEKPCPGRSR